jgi:hypothetical protein
MIHRKNAPSPHFHGVSAKAVAVPVALARVLIDPHGEHDLEQKFERVPHARS